MSKDIRRLLKSSLKTKALYPDDIPSLELYMDQITGLMHQHLGDAGEKEPLTRTMIHNYSKAGVIAPVKGKKYSKSHILQLLVVYSLKNTLTISQIKDILTGVRESGIDEVGLSHCIDTQLQRRTKINQQLMDAMEQIAEENHMSLDTPAEAMSFLLTLTDITDTLSAFAAALTAEYFPEISEKPEKKPEKKTKQNKRGK